MPARDEATRLLGIGPDASASEVEEAFRAKREALERRIEGAETELTRTRLLSELGELAQARETVIAGTVPLGEDTGLEAPPVPATRADAHESLTGQRLSERYDVMERLGGGAMGVVYVAWDSQLRTEIAIKVMSPQMLRYEQGLTRFLAEARGTRNLAHPNIVKVFDAQTDGDLTYILMERLVGRDLKAEIMSRREEGEPFELEEVFEMAFALCDALSYAHEHVIHRDLKPENVFLCRDGTLKVMDFGVAHHLEGTRLTQDGFQPGTLKYMAPEQAAGRKLTHRADQYSVGLILFELLTGHSHKPGAPVAKELRAFPRKLAHAVERTLQANPDDRFPDMRGLWDELKVARQRWRRHRRRLALRAAAVGALGIAGLVALGLWLGDPREVGSAEGRGETPTPPAPAPDPEKGDDESTADDGSTTDDGTTTDDGGDVEDESKPRDLDAQLRLAVGSGDVEAAASLLEQGAAADAASRREGGGTLLHDAVSAGEAPLARLLLEHGARVDAADDAGRTPLALAAQAGALELVELLVEARADVDSRDTAQMTPLHRAAWSTEAAVAELLVRAGADFRAVDAGHETPLHLAAERDDLATVRALVEAIAGIGGDAAALDALTATDGDSRYPQDVARASSVQDYLRGELRRLRD